MPTHLIEGDVLVVKKAGTTIGTRKTLNLIEGSNVTLTVADDNTNNRVNVTVAASGGASGVSSFNTRTGAVTLTEADVEAALTNVSFGNGQVEVSGTKVLGARQAAISHLTAGSTLADARAAINAILTALEAHGLIAP